MTDRQPLPPELIDLTTNLDAMIAETVAAETALRTIAGAAMSQAERLKNSRLALSSKLEAMGAGPKPAELVLVPVDCPQCAESEPCIRHSYQDEDPQDG